MPNIYLIGMMGSGKSVTGKSLASLLGCSFIDLDEKIEEKVQKTIAEIFKERGEDFFRAQESKVLSEASKSQGIVIATGGGAVIASENRELMKGTGSLVYLETSLDALWERVKSKQDRPLLKSENPKITLENLLGKRKSIYEECSQLKVNTDNKTADQVAKEISELIRKKT